MLRTLRAEQIKLTTLRSTWWSVGFVLVISVGVAVLIAGLVHDDVDQETSVDVLTVLYLAASFVALIGVMAMAVIMATGEYRFGQIRMTLTATPSRITVMLSKAVVAVVAGFLIGALTSWLIVGLCKPLLPSAWAISMSEEGVQRIIWGLPLFFAAAALLAMSLGALLRNSPAAIVILALLSLAVEKTLLGIEKTQKVAAYLPFNAGSRITQPSDTDGFLPEPWTGYLVFLLYALGLFVIALIVVESRDA
jgi:ABC-2 type transport system permease protein